MFVRLVNWVLECSIENPENAPWVQFAKALVCYVARLAVLCAILYLAANFGFKAVLNAL